MDEQAYYDALIAKGYAPEKALEMVRGQFPTYSNPESPQEGNAAPGTWTPPESPAAPSGPSSGPQPPPGADPAVWQRIIGALADAHSTDDPNYWYGVISKDPNGFGSAWDYWVGRIKNGEGIPGGPKGPGEGAGNPTTMPAGWFQQNAPADVSPYSTPERQPGMTAPQFQAPTLDDLLSDPGYLAQQQAITTGLEHGAAGKGTLLNGGFLGKVLPRALAENAGGSFGNLYQRKLDTFNTQNAATFGTKSLNDTQYQGDVTNALNQYKQRYQAYNDAINNQFRLADLGFSATTAGRP